MADDMRLNSLSPARVLSAQQSAWVVALVRAPEKTAGRGHKGLKARSGGTVKPGFEGGQMPLQRSACPNTALRRVLDAPLRKCVCTS